MPTDNGYVNGYYQGHGIGRPTQDALVPDPPGIIGDEVNKGTTRFGTITPDALVDEVDYNFDTEVPPEEGTGEEGGV